MAKKAAAKRSERPGEQYLIRMPPGLRERVAKRASQNGRSVSAEIVEAIEKHLESADRITRLWEFIEKHRENIENLDVIWDAVEYLESRVQNIDGQGAGPLEQWRYKKQEEARRLFKDVRPLRVDLSSGPLTRKQGEGASAVEEALAIVARGPNMVLGEPITPDQAQEVRTLLAQTGASEAALLARLGAPSIESISRSSFDSALLVMREWQSAKKKRST